MPILPCPKRSWKPPWTARECRSISESPEPTGSAAKAAGSAAERISPLRHGDVPPEALPTGEQLLERSTLPYRIWVPDRDVLVLGNSQDPELELNVDAVLEDGIPVFKRICGGGAVLLSPGCVCMALRFAKSKTLGIHDYFAKAAALITEVAAERLGIRIGLRGISDLAYLGPLEGARPLNGGSTGSELPLLMRAGERKIAGSSLYMPRDFVLYLVSILVDPDFSAIDKYLSHPSKEPDYRGGRSHKDFLAGLGPLSGAALRPADFAQWLRQGLQQKIPETPGLDLDWELSGGKPPGVG